MTNRLPHPPHRGTVHANSVSPSLPPPSSLSSASSATSRTFPTDWRMRNADVGSLHLATMGRGQGHGWMGGAPLPLQLRLPSFMFFFVHLFSSVNWVVNRKIYTEQLAVSLPMFSCFPFLRFLFLYITIEVVRTDHLFIYSWSRSDHAIGEIHVSRRLSWSMWWVKRIGGSGSLPQPLPSLLHIGIQSGPPLLLRILVKWVVSISYWRCLRKHWQTWKYTRSIKSVSSSDPRLLKKSTAQKFPIHTGQQCGYSLYK